MSLRVRLTIGVCLLTVAPLVAQSVSGPELAAVPASIPIGTRVGVSVESGYEDGGRRDPFVTLIAPKRETKAAAVDSRPKIGLAALAISDVLVRGILSNGKTRLALIEGPNKQAFTARVKDRLLDGVVQSIDADAVVFAEDGEGARGVRVRKLLHRSGEEGQ